MPLALVLSSFVAASRIGGGAQQYVLAAHRIDPVLAPTSLFGRSPAKGAVGEPTPPDVFRRMLGDIEADAVFGMVDLVITGHFSLPEQVRIAAGVLERVRATAPRQPVVIVDPIMGDAPYGRYVQPGVAEEVMQRLVPLADWITPNLWELEQMVGRPLTSAAETAAACRELGRKALVTSPPLADDRAGLLFCAADRACLFTHARRDKAPKGTGDFVAASFGAGLVEGMSPAHAAERTACAITDVIEAAAEMGAGELPVVAMADRVVRPCAGVTIELL